MTDAAPEQGEAASVSHDPVPLQMAPNGCTLDAGQLHAQLTRYRGLSRSVLRIDRRRHRVEVQFCDTVDVGLLEQTLAIERGCCSFPHWTTGRLIACSGSLPAPTAKTRWLR